jgi:hypothetical protein
MSKFIDGLKAQALKLVPTLLGDGKDVAAELPAISAILEDLDDILDDGFQWDELDDVFSSVVIPLMSLAGTNKSLTGPEKKKFVVDAITVIYFHFNPNIPILPDTFGIETRVEKFLVPKMAAIAVETSYKLYKKIKAKLAKD